MLLGVDYYPEQWDSSLLEEDLERIVTLGCNVIRIGEFAWCRMEPEDATYDFSYFDHVIHKARQKGLNVIFGTPTATPPAWFVKKYPSSLSQFENGQQRSFGGRHVCCYSDPHYMDYSRRITTELAKHYKEEPSIIAWQIDNELGHEGSDICWCPQCHAAFQQYLRAEYQNDIRKLNESWGTVFWGQEYSCFEEIPLPNQTITTHNPSLRLEWERFCSEKIVKFAESQAQILRQYIPNATIIHDFPGGGLNKHVSYAKLSQCLDRVAYNNYPVWGGQKEPLPPSEIAFGLDYIRGLKRENFWITEAIMGAQGHDITGYLPRPHQAALWSWQGVARGCDGLMYFRYRGATKGAEQFCYGILDADNVPRRRFYEVQTFFEAVKNYENILSQPVSSDIAILYDFDSLAAFRIQKQSILLDCEVEMKRLHQVFFEAGQMVDVIPCTQDFSQYKLVVVTNMLVTDPVFSERLKQYVENGGHIMVTYRTAVKDRYNNLMFGKVLPVDLDELLGIEIVETESVQEYDGIPISGTQSGTAGIFRDMLKATTAEILYHYDDMFYKEFGAISCNTYGHGHAFYLGTAPEKKILKEVCHKAMAYAGLSVWDLPQGVERIERTMGQEKVTFLLNHNAENVETGDGITLKPYEVKIV